MTVNDDGSCTPILGTFSSSLLRAAFPLRGSREFRRVFSTSCIVYLAPFARLLAGIDYLAITVFRIVRGHSCLLSAVPFSPFLSPVMAPRLLVVFLSVPALPSPPPLFLSPYLSVYLLFILFLSFWPEAPRRSSTRSLQEFFAQQRAYRYGIMQR